MKILHVYPQLNCGGTEAVIYNLIKFGDWKNNSFEILSQRKGDNEKIFSNLGVKIHYISFENSGEYHQKIVDFFSNRKFDVIHAHMDTTLPYVLKGAKEAGIKCKVAHSHNARIDIPRYLWPLFYFMHHPYEKYANLYFGCSELALKWLFPKRWRKGNVIYNGIDLGKFRFDSRMRENIRKEHSIGDKTKVFINVGRSTDQKNQKFILDLAKDRKGKNELFVIIGDGPLYKSLSDYKTEHCIDNVLLLGKRDDVAQWLSAADVFLFPSIYEGLGIVAIEAEASGMTVLASDTLPPEVDMKLGNFHRISIKDSALWHQMMDLEPLDSNRRFAISENAQNSEYDIHNVTSYVESQYQKFCH